ncbi:MAG TPA: site-specific integrase [Acidimicrobiales bacterium]
MSARRHFGSIRRLIRRGVWLNPTEGRVTLREWSNQWLSNRADLRPVTRAKYRHMLDRHVLPVLGKHELSKLRPSAVRAWYMDMKRKYVSTADDAYRMLRAILSTAVSDELIARNPCRVKGAGQARSAERPVASVAEVEAAAAATPDHHRLVILLAAWCQLRRGEVLGLQRRDIDLLHGRIRIERAVVRPMIGQAVVGPPKTTAGQRTVAVPSNILPALKNHLGRFVGPAPDAWLFTSSDGGSMLPSTLNRIWQRARRSIDRPDLYYHDLRHSGLTWSAASGASVAELMRRGGHSHPAAALRYQHATEDRDRAIADALAQLVVGNVSALTDSSGMSEREDSNGTGA